MASSLVSPCFWRPLAVAFVVGLVGRGVASAQVVSDPPPPAVEGRVEPVLALPADAPAPRVMPSFASLFTDLPQDFRHLLTPQNLAIAGIGGLGASVGHSFDNRVARTAWGSEETFESGQIVGSFLAQSGGAVATYAVGRLTRSPRVAQFGSELFRAQVLTQATVQAVKFAAGRQRPDGTSQSFPSGHSAAAFATATVIHHEFGWKAGIPAFAVAGFVASSRVQMRRHYISDVIAGATVGILAGRSVTVGSGRARFSVDPMPLPGGMGVSFTRVIKK
jgi:membrane-associated phospholipid phosphatase